jgi:membrane protease YdiL (CAAX protease family)
MCGVGFVLLVLNPLLQYSPPTEFVEPHPGNVINAGGAWAKLSLVLAVILFAPVSEEFLFRGVLYQTIAQSTNRAISALVVSSIFIALHPDALRTGYWVTHAILYTFPFVLVALREATGSIHGPILAHAGFNAVEIFI